MNTPPRFTGELILLEKNLPNVPRETLQDLLRYADLAISWNKKINLTGARSLQEFIELHIQDSFAAMNLITKKRGVIDVGSGAGLPGLVWAISCPFLPIVLVESSLKRCSFLEKVKAELALSNVHVFPRRFEGLREIDLPKIDFGWDVVSRGTAAPKELLALAQSALIDWGTWYVFSNERIHAEYLKEAPSVRIKIEKGDYSKFLYRGMKSKGLLTCLHRDR